MSATRYYVGPPKIIILIEGGFNSENLLNIYSPSRHFVVSSGRRKKISTFLFNWNTFAIKP